jgi:hypothetical protein
MLGTGSHLISHVFWQRWGEMLSRSTPFASSGKHNITLDYRRECRRSQLHESLNNITSTSPAATDWLDTGYVRDWEMERRE